MTTTGNPRDLDDGGGPESGDGMAGRDGVRPGLSAPIWIGILTAAILALVVFIGRNSFAA